jgi:potassium efflux system protein
MAASSTLRRLAASFFLVTLSFLPTAAFAPAAAQIDTGIPAKLHNELKEIGASLRLEQMSAAELGAALDKVMALKNRAGECRQEAQSALDQAQQAEQALGKPETHENAELAKTRQTIATYKGKAANSLAECRLDVVIADILAARIGEQQKSELARHLTESGENVLALARDNIAEPRPWIDAAVGLLSGAAGRAALFRVVALLLGAAVGGAFLGQWASRQLQWRTRPLPAGSFTARVRHAFTGSFARYAAPWAAASAVAGTFWAGRAVGAAAPVAAVAMGASGFMTAKIVLYGLLAPPAPARQITPLPDPLAHSFARRLSVLSAVMVLGLVLSLDPQQESLPAYAYDLGRAIFVTVLAVNLGWLTWLVGWVPKFQETGRLLRLALLAGLGVIVAAEWLGYRNLSSYLLEGLLESLAIGAGLWLANAAIGELCASLDGTRAGWTTGLRRSIGLAADEGFPGLVWLRLFAIGVVTLAAGLLLLHAWGLSNAGTALVLGYLVDGVAVGDMHFVPARVLTGLIIFAALLGATRWLKNWAETKWLAKSHMDRGAKDTAVAMVGYAGFVLATLTGLSASGVSLANLAIIASALSVGIGFGLQNIVSNFVAGLILLFERPIKTGDWVVVGGTEGYVKRIRVRATEIRTFEQSDVTVPNSDLITGHVKNWTLRDHLGQAVVPIAVPHGSDTELVRRLLLEIARGHPGILADCPHDPVKVLFRSFGETTLNFELHFIVRNVEQRLDVISDVNFAIDRRFREHALRP